MWLAKQLRDVLRDDAAGGVSTDGRGVRLVVGPLRLEKAGVGRRLTALAIDWLPISGIFGTADALRSFPTLQGAAYATGILIALTYFPVSYVMGSTFGMRIVGLRVMSKDGGPVGIWRAIARSLAVTAYLFVVPGFLFGTVVGWIVLLVLLLRRRNPFDVQFLGTVVVRANARVAAENPPATG